MKSMKKIAIICLFLLTGITSLSAKEIVIAGVSGGCTTIPPNRVRCTCYLISTQTCMVINVPDIGSTGLRCTLYNQQGTPSSSFEIVGYSIQSEGSLSTIIMGLP